MPKHSSVYERVAPFRITKPKSFRLKDIAPDDTMGLSMDKSEAGELLQRGVARLAELQEMLYAQDRWGLLVVLQAMDAAGKDGAIKHVMSGINPQGCEVTAFKQPSATELDHDFMWRSMRRAPERGRIGIFNRSYYEEVLIARVHPQVLAGQKLPPKLVTKRIWEERFEDINAYERYLTRNGIAICKIFLHVSKEEQRKRFLERAQEKDKHWKFSTADVVERGHWNAYQHAYEEMIRATSTPWAPWHVVPADTKWFTRLVVAGSVIGMLEELDLHYPKVPPEQERAIRAAERQLLAEGGKGKAASKSKAKAKALKAKAAKAKSR